MARLFYWAFSTLELRRVKFMAMRIESLFVRAILYAQWRPFYSIYVYDACKNGTCFVDTLFFMPGGSILFYSWLEQRHDNLYRLLSFFRNASKGSGLLTNLSEWEPTMIDRAIKSLKHIINDSTDNNKWLVIPSSCQMDDFNRLNRHLQLMWIPTLNHLKVKQRKANFPIAWSKFTPNP